MKALFTLSTNLIPVMDFERHFMAVSGTTLDQTRFALAFIGALLSGFLIRYIPGAKGVSAVQCWTSWCAGPKACTSPTALAHALMWWRREQLEHLQRPSCPDSCSVKALPCSHRTMSGTQHCAAESGLTSLHPARRAANCHAVQLATCSAQSWVSCWCTTPLAAMLCMVL